ncbi:TolC family protein [Filimonas effusa]|uniref:TolC family protein n=2 Tax=Filimonas effusa TaxID=2508721 RepID=A0A4Q1DER2_9BACT|nr:TolC family protein [Filimonas effusa]
MKHVIRTAMTGLAILSIMLTRAQDKMPLTLQQTITLCLQNSKQLKIDKAKIEAATAQLREAMDNRLPDVGVNASYLLLTKPHIDFKSDGGSGSGGSSIAQPSQATYGMATVNIPIYAGLKVRYGIESARYLQQAAESDAGYNKEQVVSNAVAAFCNLYKSGTAVQLVKENLGQSQQRDHDFSNMEKNGLLARNDLLKAQLQTANIEMALVNAENNLKLAMVSLNLLAGLPEQTTLQPDTTGFYLQQQLLSVDAYEQQAFLNRKDLEAINLRKKATEASVRSAKGDYYPSVGLTGGYVAAYIPDLLTATNVVNGGIGVRYNIDALWKAKAKVETAQASERQIAAQKEMLNDNIRLGINKAYQDYLSAEKKIEVQQKSVINATENYRITKNKHDNNLVTTTELLDANVALLQAKINLEEARADKVLTYNTLLEKAGILVNNQPKN